MKTLQITVKEVGHQDFGVDMELPDEAFLLDWTNFSVRYLIPAMERIRHRDCGPSIEECCVPDLNEYLCP